MFSARLFGGQDEVFDFLEGRAQRCRASVQALIGLVKAGGQAVHAVPSTARRASEKGSTRETSAVLCGGFLSGLEREDVEALASALDDVTRP
jgi:hypothetical protein